MLSAIVLCSWVLLLASMYASAALGRARGATADIDTAGATDTCSFALKSISASHEPLNPVGDMMGKQQFQGQESAQCPSFFCEKVKVPNHGLPSCTGGTIWVTYFIATDAVILPLPTSKFNPVPVFAVRQKVLPGSVVQQSLPPIAPRQNVYLEFAGMRSL